MDWAKTEHGDSWHIVREVFDTSLCGKKIDPKTIQTEGPGNEKTCESCLRLKVKD